METTNSLPLFNPNALIYHQDLMERSPSGFVILKGARENLKAARFRLPVKKTNCFILTQVQCTNAMTSHKMTKKMRTFLGYILKKIMMMALKCLECLSKNIIEIKH